MGLDTAGCCDKEQPGHALDHALQQVDLTRASGAVRASELINGMNVAYCELAMGRVDVAEQHARRALAASGDSDQGVGHALDTLMMCLAVQGKLDEAIAAGRRAYADLDAAGDEFMMPRRPGAAQQGRFRDATITAVRSDVEVRGSKVSSLAFERGVAPPHRRHAVHRASG